MAVLRKGLRYINITCMKNIKLKKEVSDFRWDGFTCEYYYSVDRTFMHIVLVKRQESLAAL